MKTAKLTIRLLREFSVQHPELGVSELARRLVLDKATIHRLLRSLCEEGIIEQNLATKRYRLGLAILDLAASRLQALGFVELAAGEMRSLREEVGESVGLHVRDGRDMVCVHYNEASHPLTVRFTLGERSPVHVTATGLISLAEMSAQDSASVVEEAARAYPAFPAPDINDFSEKLAKVRQEQLSVADQSYQKGVRGIAVPIRDGDGSLVATLSIVAPASRLSTVELLKHRSVLTETARRIGRKIPVGMEVLAANAAQTS